MGSDAEGRKALREATAHYATITEAGHAPKSTEAICREVMKNLKKKKKSEVDFAPCLNTKDTPGSLPEVKWSPVLGPRA
jgi:hypothetical protein